MPTISVPIERFLFGNENWRSYRAADEIGVYCDLLDILQTRIDSLQTRGKDEEVTLVNVQAVISSYAVEIAMKSLWALDNSPATPPRGRDGHDLLIILDGLKKRLSIRLANFNLLGKYWRVFPHLSLVTGTQWKLAAETSWSMSQASEVTCTVAAEQARSIEKGTTIVDIKPFKVLLLKLMTGRDTRGGVGYDSSIS